jgi:hypothetical protein
MIIGIGHRKGQGKDTFAKLLEEGLKTYTSNVKIVAFADPVYEVCSMLFGTESREYYIKYPAIKEVKNPLGKSPRDYLLAVGMKMREIDPDVWVEALKIKNIQDGYEFCIVPDLRFYNEMKYVKGNGVAVKIERAGYTVPDELRHDVADDCLADYNDWDFVIDNKYGLVGLKDQANELARKIAYGR